MLMRDFFKNFRIHVSTGDSELNRTQTEKDFIAQICFVFFNQNPEAFMSVVLK